MDKSYKFKSLKVYGSKEFLADSKKKYKRVFQESEVGYIYCEIAFYNKLFDEEPWKVKARYICEEIDANGKVVKEIAVLKADKDVKITDNIVYSREGWGNSEKGGFWKKGRYKWRAFLNDELVGTTHMYIEDGGPVTTEENPFFNILSLKLYEGPNSRINEEDRVYLSQFYSKETRYIWSELVIENTYSSDEWFSEFFFNYYNDARQLKGIGTDFQVIKKGADQITIVSGWGSDSKGTWYDDNYTLEVVFMGQLQAVVAFKCGDENIEGEVPFINSTTGVDITARGKIEEKSLDENLSEFNELIGLESIKNQITDYIQYLKFLQLREEKGLKEGQKINLHSVYTGNPGTGKTTVAKKMGKIYKNMGLLSRGHVHEVDRADLVAEFIGQTAPKVKKAIKKARGGILFIDEAYALYRGGDDSKDFGREVIEILIKEMSDGKGDIAIIAAGYPKEMDNFINSNPGLKSRFNMYFKFPDYLPDELLAISEYAAGKREVKLTPMANEFLHEKIVEAYRNRDRSFGNARFVNSVIEEAKMNMGLRIMRSEEQNQDLSKEELSIIELEDIELIFGKSKLRLTELPIDEDLLHISLAELKSMIGLQGVKDEIQELVKLVKFYREIGKDVMNSFSLHTVFTGNPGTGKTTVARILAKIFKALGILERGHIVECDRSSLVSGYSGQTAIKTSEKIEEAMGGVLFVDEAYALSSDGGGGFGKEAIETILKKMEDRRSEFMVIAAGYPDNMKTFIQSNPGLKSRFDKFIHFDDFTVEELFQICLLMFEKENIVPDEGAASALNEYFSFLHNRKDKFFGNARSVRKVVEEAVKNQHLRLASMESEKRTAEVLRTLVKEDVAEFNPQKHDMFKTSGTAIGFSSSHKEGVAAPKE